MPGALADAIAEQYRPSGPTDEVPDAPLAMAIALADKLDTLVGFFAVGEKPTGSRDPYALRRAALGLIRIILKSDVRLPIRAAVKDWYRALKTYAAPGRAVYASAARTTGWIGDGWDAPGGAMETYLDELEVALTTEPAYVIAVSEDRPVAFDRTAIVTRPPSQPVIYRFRAAREVAEEVTSFLIERLKVLLRDQGARHDLVDAVFALGDDDLVRIMRRIEALGRFLATADGANLLAGYKRASNILAAEAKKGAVPVGTPVALPGAPTEETALIKALTQAIPKVESALDAENFAAAMSALAALRPAVDAFFDKVLVNSDKAGERENRLKLLGEVRAADGPGGGLLAGLGIGMVMVGTLTRKRFVYAFGGGGADGDASMKDLLGGKGANLAEMSSLGLPVPPGFTITTEACTHFYANQRRYPDSLREEVADGADRG